MPKRQESLITKYRPKDFSEVLGQPFLVEELQGLIKTKAYTYTNSMIVSGASGGGKAQPLHSKVFTPDRGFVRLEDLQVGDAISGELGDVHKVLGKYLQGAKKSYKITFEDNTSTECSKDHLWKVFNRKTQSAEVRSLKQLMKEHRKNAYHDIHIETSKAIQQETKETEIDPYLFGLLFGGGELIEKGVRYKCKYSDTLERVLEVSKAKKKGDFIYIKDTKLRDTLRGQKQIPKEYLHNDTDTRLKLIRGLFESCGVVEDRELYFENQSRRVREQYCDVMRSLGYKVREEEQRVKIWRNKYLPTPYRARELTNLVTYPWEDIGDFVKIKKVERLKKVEMVCIKTSNPTSLYLTDNFKVTHNTTIARVFAKAVNCEGKSKPCNKCDNCKAIDNNNYPDYLELDATSYRGVKEVEPLKILASQFPNRKGGTRIIYLDEAHTLSNQAWDTLLKLLEEGRNSTLFLFATTQLHSIRPAIVNRSQVFKVRPTSREETVLELQRIATLEKIKAPRELLDNIARVHSKGLRDAISGLDTLYKTHGSDLSKIKVENMKSQEDSLLEIIGNLPKKGLVKATIALELLEVDPREFNRVMTNILIALYLSKSKGQEEEIKELGIHPKLISKVSKQFDNLDKLIEMTATYNFNTKEQVKVYFILLDTLVRAEEVEEKVVTVEEKIEHKRRGLRVKVKEEKPKSKVKKKKNKNSDWKKL